MKERIDILIGRLGDLDLRVTRVNDTTTTAQCPECRRENQTLVVTCKKHDTITAECETGCDVKRVLQHLGLTYQHLIPGGEAPETGSDARPGGTGKTGAFSRDRRTRANAQVWDAMTMTHLLELDNSIVLINQLESKTRIDIETLRLLYVGYSKVEDAYTFPMFDEFGRTIGIRLHTHEGDKGSITGSINGIYYPDPMIMSMTAQDPLFVCEGPLNTASIANLGLFAAGRSTWAGGEDYIIGLANRMGHKRVVFVTNSRGDGIKGAVKIAEAIMRGKRQVWFIPPGKGNNAHTWVTQHGATRESVVSMLDAHKPFDPRVWHKLRMAESEGSAA